MTQAEIAAKRAEIEARDRADLAAFRAGQLTEMEAQERGTLRQYERIWLRWEEKLVRNRVSSEGVEGRAKKIFK